MLDFIALQAGFDLLFADASTWLIVIPGILIGLLFGAVPGLQISMAMAIFLPMTLYHPELNHVAFQSLIIWLEIF